MRHRKKKAAKDWKASRKAAESTPNQGISDMSNGMTKNITKENGSATNVDKGKLESNLTKDLSLTTDTSILNGAANKEKFYLINGHEIPKAYIKSIVAAQQLSVDLAQNSHTFLRYGTYATLVIAFLLVFPYYFSIIMRPNLPTVMDGIVAPGFEKVAETFKYVLILSLLPSLVLKTTALICS